MIDEKIYQEYANWLMDYEDILKKVTDSESPFSTRFKHVYDVVDYMYNKLIDDKDYSEVDDQIFRTGISYLSEIVYELDNILENVYSGDYEELEKDAVNINLILNITDFKNEMSIFEERDENDFIELVKLYNDIYENYIVKKEQIPLKKYQEFEVINERMIQKLELNYYSVGDIFLEIADELGIV